MYTSPTRPGAEAFEALAKSASGGITGLRVGIIGAVGYRGLTMQRIENFIRDLPEDKRGEVLWNKFRRRCTERGDKQSYSFGDFILEEFGLTSRR